MSKGLFMRKDESNKIHRYLRALLALVSEAGFPNAVLNRSRIRTIVDNGNAASMVDAAPGAVTPTRG